MIKNKRQVKARKIIMISSRRMLAELLNISPRSFEKEISCFKDDELCDAIRSLYGRTQKQPDRLTKAYDLASLVR